jgi:hypothetical protein
MHTDVPFRLLPADVASHQPHGPGQSSGMGSRGGVSKNGGALRVGPSLPLKMPSAMRKRGFDETMAEVSWLTGLEHATGIGL